MNAKLLAIIAVIVVVAAAAAAVFVVTNDDDDDGFTIVDGKGTEFKFDEPIDVCASVNTNVPKAMKLLGLEDNLKGISFYTSKATTDAANWEQYKVLFPKSVHLSMTKSLTGEELIQNGIHYVVAPVESMTVSADQETAYNALGIKVIRLDCNGDSTFDDYEKLLKIFNGSKDKYNAYKDTANSVVNNVISKMKASGNYSDKTFLAYMNSAEAFYNQTSVISENIEKLYGKNALRSISNLDTSGVSNDAKVDGLKEQIIALDSSKAVDKLFLRGSASTSTVKKAQELWDGSIIKSAYGSTNVVKNGEVYIFDSDMMSGSLYYVGFVLYAEMCGVETGYSVADLITAYNTTYGFDEETGGVAFKLNGSTGKVTEFVVV